MTLLRKNSAELDSLETATQKLLDYCRRRDWAGIDPYDMLNCPYFRRLVQGNCRWPRIILTQLSKRSPIDFRPLLGIPPTQNPKALAVFLSALLNLHRIGFLPDCGLIFGLVKRLNELKSPHSNLSSWGYSFPWQTRTKIVPRGYPNLVCTVFVANALLDCYEAFDNRTCLNMAHEAGRFILSELHWEEGESRAGFGYPLPSMQSPVHNANLLGAALLSRLYHTFSIEEYSVVALKVARYAVTRQNPDGSWRYGELPTQNWIDNFHTGYNLVALNEMNHFLETSEFAESVHKGFLFYMRHFFRDDGAPRYYHNRDYPVDAHCVAQSIITLVTLRSFDQNSMTTAKRAFEWAMVHLWDHQGYFYYQVHPCYTNRISYMRWTQAWMLLAMSQFLKEVHPGHHSGER